MDSCTLKAVLIVDRDHIIDLSMRRTLSNLFSHSSRQYPFLASRWCAFFRFPRFPHTEPCLLTRDLWKRSGVGLPNLSSHTPLNTPLSTPSISAISPIALPPPSPSRGQSHRGGSSNKLPGTALLKWAKSKRKRGSWIGSAMNPLQRTTILMNLKWICIAWHDEPKDNPVFSWHRQPDILQTLKDAQNNRSKKLLSQQLTN